MVSSITFRASRGFGTSWAGELASIVIARYIHKMSSKPTRSNTRLPKAFLEHGRGDNGDVHAKLH
jgi:hypothetical protein